MPLTRQQLIQSLTYKRLIALPNDILCNIMQKHVDDSNSSPFAGWTTEVYAIDDTNETGTAPVAGTVMIATTSNSAPGGDGITQKTYFFST